MAVAPPYTALIQMYLKWGTWSSCNGGRRGAPAGVLTSWRRCASLRSSSILSLRGTPEPAPWAGMGDRGSLDLSPQNGGQRVPAPRVNRPLRRSPSHPFIPNSEFRIPRSALSVPFRIPNSELRVIFSIPNSNSEFRIRIPNSELPLPIRNPQFPYSPANCPVTSVPRMLFFTASQRDLQLMVVAVLDIISDLTYIATWRYLDAETLGLAPRRGQDPTVLASRAPLRLHLRA